MKCETCKKEIKKGKEYKVPAYPDKVFCNEDCWSKYTLKGASAANKQLSQLMFR